MAASDDPILDEYLNDMEMLRESFHLSKHLDELLDRPAGRDEVAVMCALMHQFRVACEYAEIDPLAAASQLLDALGTDRFARRLYRDPAKLRWVHHSSELLQ